MPVAEYTIPGMHIRDHLVPVPLDWSDPGGSPTIEVFVREVVDPSKKAEKLPLLVFLQGGPGGKSPRPSAGSPPWLAEALKTHRVILPDQRGTGRSSRIEAATMAQFADGAAGADSSSSSAPTPSSTTSSTCGRRCSGAGAGSRSVRAMAAS